MIAPDETDELPEAADAITSAIGALIVSVMEATETDSPERARAMGEVLQAAERIRAVLHKQRLN
jgi:phytoene/squalene synthetase